MFGFMPNDEVHPCCWPTSPTIASLSELKNDLSDKNVESFVHKVINNLNHIVESIKKGNVPVYCQECPNLASTYDQSKIKNLSTPLSRLGLFHFHTCNLKCSFCVNQKYPGQYKDTDSDFVLNLLKKMLDMNLICKSTWFDIAGGEPSINRKIEKIVSWIQQNNLHCWISSNATRLSQIFVDAVNDGTCILYLTLDAGSRSVYTKIKGADLFEKCIKNILSYQKKTNSKANVKFVLNLNNYQDVENMVAVCQSTKSKNVVVSYDYFLSKEAESTIRNSLVEFVQKSENVDVRLNFDYKYKDVSTYDAIMQECYKKLHLENHQKDEIFLYCANSLSQKLYSIMKDKYSVKAVFDKNATHISDSVKSSFDCPLIPFDKNAISKNSTIVICSYRYGDELKSYLEDILKNVPKTILLFP